MVRRLLVVVISIALLCQSCSLVEDSPPSETSENCQLIAAATIAAEAIEKLLPDGWSLQQQESKIVISSDKLIEVIPPNSPMPPVRNGVQNWDGISRPKAYTVTLRFGPLVTDKESAHLLAENAATRKKMHEMQKKIEHVPHKADSYLTANCSPEDKKLVDAYNRLKSSLKDPPDFYDSKTSIWVKNSFTEPYSYMEGIVPDSKQVLDECRRIQDEILGLFQKYPIDKTAEVGAVLTKIREIESLCTPAEGTSREEVEKRFGKGKPTVVSKIPVDAPPDSRLREYIFCENGTLLVRYDNETNSKVHWAHYIDPYSVKGRPKGRPSGSVPAMQERLGELIPRLKQMEAILKEYQQRFGNVHESGDYTESSWLLPAGKELLLKIKLKKSLS